MSHWVAVLIWYTAGYFEAKFSSLHVSWPHLPHSFCQFPQVTGFLNFLWTGVREGGKQKWPERLCLDLFFQEHKLIGELTSFAKGKKRKKGVSAKGKDLDKPEEGFLCLLHQYPGMREEQRGLDSRSQQCSCCFLAMSNEAAKPQRGMATW